MRLSPWIPLASQSLPARISPAPENCLSAISSLRSFALRDDLWGTNSFPCSLKPGKRLPFPRLSNSATNSNPGCSMSCFVPLPEKLIPCSLLKHFMVSEYSQLMVQTSTFPQTLRIRLLSFRKVTGRHRIICSI